MGDGQFRFTYFTDRYDETVAFYRDGVNFPLLHAWDRSADDKGTLLIAACGTIEVLHAPAGPCDHLFDPRPPQGVFMAIEVEDLECLGAMPRPRACRSISRSRINPGATAASAARAEWAGALLLLQNLLTGAARNFLAFAGNPANGRLADRHGGNSPEAVPAA